MIVTLWECYYSCSVTLACIQCVYIISFPLKCHTKLSWVIPLVLSVPDIACIAHAFTEAGTHFSIEMA